MNIKDIREYAEDGYHIHPKLVIELIDRLEAAESYAAHWANVFGHLGTPDECGNEWSALVTKLEAAEKDAARYRFLKTGTSCDIGLMELDEEDGEFYCVCFVTGNYIDDKIDTAMKEQL